MYQAKDLKRHIFELPNNPTIAFTVKIMMAPSKYPSVPWW